MSEKLYYLQNRAEGYSFDSPMFWAKSGGYTQWLDDAKKFTADEANVLIRSTRGTHNFKRWSVTFVDRRAKRTVDMQDLRPKRKKINTEGKP